MHTASFPTVGASATWYQVSVPQVGDPQANMFEQVSSLGHQISLAGGPDPVQWGPSWTSPWWGPMHNG